MYVRDQPIEEENLDWGEDGKKTDTPEIDAEKKETKHVIHPTNDHNKIVFQKKIKFSQINIKKIISNLLDEHGEVYLLLGILTIPYIIGFFVVSFILLYGRVPIDRFFGLRDEIFHFELWSIGAYIFITIIVIWLVIMLLLHKR